MFEYRQELLKEEAYEIKQITKARLAEIKEKKIDWFIYSEDSIDLGVATDIVTGF